MRIASSMIYDAGVASMQKQTSALLHTQQQLASGRRILTPSDDPVAAARALEVEQARDTNAIYLNNQKMAGESLALLDDNLAQAGNLLTRVRELAVQAGNASLSASDRRSLTFELRHRFEELLGIANAKDGTGQYLFSGYMGDTLPFSGAVGSGASYAGDDGQRKQQVSATRQLATSESGTDVFMRIRNGNGSFATSANAANAGSGIVDAGTVTNPSLWGAAGNNKDFTVVFAVNSAVAPPVTTYDVLDNVSGNSLLTGAPPAAAPYPRVFVPGQAISLKSQGAEPAFDYGAQFVITGSPANGDSFDIGASTSQSLFATLENLIAAIEAPVGVGSGNTLLTNRLGSALTNLDQGLDNLLRVRASTGARMQELDALGSVGEDYGLHYQQTLSRLQDIDYAEAISSLTQQQTYLEAAQKSYLRVAGLSLFNYV